jgi:glycosyltransferase involved in cell wall biosynthesis
VPASTGRWRVLFVSLVPAYWAGSEVLWSAAAKDLCAKGHLVGAYYGFFKSVPQTRDLESFGVQSFYGTRPPERWWRRLMRRHNGENRFEACLQAFQPDIIVLSQGDLPEGAPEMQQCIALRRSFCVVNQLTRPTYTRDEADRTRHWLSCARHIWFVSVENRDAARANLRLSLTEASVISNGFACPYDVDGNWPRDDDSTRLACVGRLEVDHKGQDALLDALAQPRWRYRPVELTFFGEGPDRARLENQARTLGLRNVRFAGHQSAIAQIWCNHHALVLPSHYEGQSLAMLEAMLHGRPAIVTPVGGTSGVVVDGRTGFVAPGFTRDDLDHVLDRAWKQRAAWRVIGESARRHVRTIVRRDFGGHLADEIIDLARAE